MKEKKERKQATVSAKKTVCVYIHRVHTHFARSNSDTFQTLLRVIFTFFQHLITGVNYIFIGIHLVYTNPMQLFCNEDFYGTAYSVQFFVDTFTEESNQFCDSLLRS